MILWFRLQRNAGLHSRGFMESNKGTHVFIDGNNFYHCLSRSKIRPSNIDFLKLSNFVCRKFGLVYSKTCYYNSIPNISQGEERYYAHMKFLEQLRKPHSFEVKTRKLQNRSNLELVNQTDREISDIDICKKCIEKVRNYFTGKLDKIQEKEKGIDVMLAIDMVEKAIKNNYDSVVLISGDADFNPALDLIKENGKAVFVASVFHGFSNELRQRQRFIVLSSQELEAHCFKQFF